MPEPEQQVEQEQETGARLRGRVLKFEHGWGFLRPEGWKRDLFVHFSELEMEGYKHLEEGQVVEFEVGKREGRLQANRVVVIESEEPR